MPEISLKQLAEITGGKLDGDPKASISYIETDSRRISMNPNSLFVAISGAHHNGHHYIPDLAERGIVNFLVDHNFEPVGSASQANFIRVQDTLAAFQKLAGWYRKQLSMPLLAITGSNGKTVVKEWLAQILANWGGVSRSPKSYNSQLGVPLSLWMLSPKADWAIIEAGISMPGEMEKLGHMILPELGIFTNIGPAHQENFKDIAQKVREKLKLFESCKTLYYCADHTAIHKEVTSLHHTFNTCCWSVNDTNCSLFVQSIRKNTQQTSVELKYGGNLHWLNFPFTDDASVENCLHMLNFLTDQGFNIKETEAAIQKLRPVAMRLEQIAGIHQSTVINDSYNADIHSLKIALDFLAMQKQHQKQTVILSDIRQSGLPEDKLYAEVAQLVSSYHISQLLVVGPQISASDKIPASAGRYASTEDLLADISRLDFSHHAILVKGARDFKFEQVVNALSEKKHTTVLEINLNNLVHNLNVFREQLAPNTKIMVMVKALGYGSGSFEIANLLQHQKVDYLGVAFTDEGIVLRNAGITLPVMVMAPSTESYEKIIEYKLEPEIFSFDGLITFSEAVNRMQLDEYPIHLKLDTGMHRLGFMENELDRLAERIKQLGNIQVKAIFSHLAVADNAEEDEFSQGQIKIFEQGYRFMTDKLGYKPLRHMLNSAGIERFPEAHFEMVRLGIGLHGISATNKPLLPVSTLKTRISQIKKLKKGDTVGYNRRGKIEQDSQIATIPVGYADGLDRKLGNGNAHVIINDKHAPFIGDICMDLSMIDITGIAAKEGDEVIIFGKGNSIQQLARQLETIPYEILTNVSARVKRIYVNE